ADVANHWVVLLLIGFGVWVLASRTLYLGGRYQLTGWGASGLGLLVLGTTWFESHAGQNDALANYLPARCFTADLVAYVLALGVLFAGLLMSRTPAPVTPSADKPTLALLLRADWMFTLIGLAGGCLLGVALRDPLLLSGASPWM